MRHGSSVGTLRHSGTDTHCLASLTATRDKEGLRFEVRYFDSHVRTRAIAEDGSYTDSIGANDLAEAILLIGQVVRFGETMNACRLRSRK